MDIAVVPFRKGWRKYADFVLRCDVSPLMIVVMNEVPHRADVITQLLGEG